VTLTVVALAIAAVRASDQSGITTATNLFESHVTLTSDHSTHGYNFLTGAVIASPLYRGVTFRPRTVGVATTYQWVRREMEPI